MPKKTKGTGIKKIATKVYEKAKAAYDWAKLHKPAGTLLSYVPQAGSIPYAGKALKVLASAGFGKKKKMMKKC